MENVLCTRGRKCEPFFESVASTIYMKEVLNDIFIVTLL